MTRIPLQRIGEAAATLLLATLMVVLLILAHGCSGAEGVGSSQWPPAFDNPRGSGNGTFCVTTNGVDTCWEIATTHEEGEHCIRGSMDVTYPPIGTAHADFTFPGSSDSCGPQGVTGVAFRPFQPAAAVVVPGGIDGDGGDVAPVAPGPADADPSDAVVIE